MVRVTINNRRNFSNNVKLCVNTIIHEIQYTPPSPTAVSRVRRILSVAVCSGVPRNFFRGEGVSPGIFFGGRRFNKFSWGQRAERTEIWGRLPPCQWFHSICKWVKPVFSLGCYGFIFHGSRNMAQLWNFGGGGLSPPTPLGTLLAVCRNRRKYTYICNLQLLPPPLLRQLLTCLSVLITSFVMYVSVTFSLLRNVRCASPSCCR
jgi:hypothetical protein